MAARDERNESLPAAASQERRAAIKGAAPALVRRRERPADRARPRAGRSRVELGRARAGARPRPPSPRSRPAGPRGLLAARGRAEPGAVRRPARAADRTRAGLPRQLVVGHSLGCLVALRLAMRSPELVRGLVLVSAAGIGSTSRRARQALWLTSLVQPGRFSRRSASGSPGRIPARVRLGHPGRRRTGRRFPPRRRSACSRARSCTATSPAQPARWQRTTPAIDLERVRCPTLARLGRARPAGAGRRRVRVCEAPASAAPRRRRGRAPGDRRAARGLPRRDPELPRPGSLARCSQLRCRSALRASWPVPGRRSARLRSGPAAT